MTVSPVRQGREMRTAMYGPQIVTGPFTPPTVTSTLWTVANGNILVTSMFVVITTAMSGTATTLNVGFSGTGGTATALMNAGVLTSLAVGALVSRVPNITTEIPPATGGVSVTTGVINWIASAVQTGLVKVYMNYIPLDSDVTVG